MVRLYRFYLLYDCLLCFFKLMILLGHQRLAALTQVLENVMPKTDDVEDVEMDQFPAGDVSVLHFLPIFFIDGLV